MKHTQSLFPILTTLTLLMSANCNHKLLAEGRHHNRTQAPLETVIKTAYPRVNSSTIPMQRTPADGWVVDALQAEPRLRGSHITVTVSSKGDITLDGSVSHKYQKRLAGRIAKRTASFHIINHITIR